MSVGDNINQAYAFAKEVNLSSGIPAPAPISRRGSHLQPNPTLQEKEIAIENIIRYNLKCEENRRTVLELIYNGVVTRFIIDYGHMTPNLKFNFIIYNLQIHFYCPVKKNSHIPIIDEKHFVDLVKYITFLTQSDAVKQVSRLIEDKVIIGVNININLGKDGNVYISCNLPGRIQFQVDSFEKLLEKFDQFQQLQSSDESDYPYQPPDMDNLSDIIIERAYTFAHQIGLVYPDAIFSTIPSQPTIEMKRTYLKNVIKRGLESEGYRQFILHMICNPLFDMKFNIRSSAHDLNVVFSFDMYNVINIEFVCPVDRNTIFPYLGNSHFVDLVEFIISISRSLERPAFSWIICHSVNHKIVSNINIKVDKNQRMSITYKYNNKDINVSSLDVLVIHLGKYMGETFDFEKSQTSVITSKLLSYPPEKPEYESAPSTSTSISMSSLTSTSITIFPILTPPFPKSNFHLRLGQDIGIYQIINFDPVIHHVDSKWIYNIVPFESIKLFTADPSDQKAWMTFLFRFKISQDPTKHYIFVIDKSEGILENLYDSFIRS